MKLGTVEPSLIEQLTAFAPIGRSELTATADLQNRTDRKYLVPEADVPGILRHIQAGLGSACRVLTIGGRNQFAYRSTYFDSARLDSYYSAAHRRPSRFKLRARQYLDTHTSMLEIKMPDRRGRKVKHRAACDPCEADGLTAEGRAFVESIERTRALAGELRPVLTTSYLRATLCITAGETARVTVDTELCWRSVGLSWHGAGRQLRFGPTAVIETKTSGVPCAVDRILWRSGIRPVAFSKYCTGLAALTPTLPANKWNRVLRRHLNWHPQRGDTAHVPPASADAQPGVTMTPSLRSASIESAS
ncbi:polyphosphate polymerase domain-containing protein [Candidatus Poriferisodalis sp.]|uniref:polyphosphate polymerase domain-containing protein n=1 Tax=Candidatus Poriferisodalis sp. TaxID=3101277 RepID=UPI003B0219CC